MAKRSWWWGLQCVFWYWWDWGLPLISRHDTAWWFGFNLLDTYNGDELLCDEEDTPREAVETDVSYWEE